MLTIFNRRELLVLFSQEKLYAVKGALDDAGIPHYVKYNTPTGRVSGHGRGTAFLDLDAAREYKVYIHRDDYDLARAAIARV